MSGRRAKVYVTPEAFEALRKGRPVEVEAIEWCERLDQRAPGRLGLDGPKTREELLRHESGLTGRKAVCVIARRAE